MPPVRSALLLIPNRPAQAITHGNLNGFGIEHVLIFLFGWVDAVHASAVAADDKLITDSFFNFCRAGLFEVLYLGSHGATEYSHPGYSSQFVASPPP